MKILQGVLVLFMLIGFLGCEDEDGEEDSASTTQGWHFQGRDCLACHNVDLQGEKHLIVGGTLFKIANVTDQDNLDNSCGSEELVINFLDSSFNLIDSSRSYSDSSSNGYKGKGNLFILARTMDTLVGDYYVQITTQNGNELAQSSGLHRFTDTPYDITNSADNANRRSCNACHLQGGQTSPLYVQRNPQLCE